MLSSPRSLGTNPRPSPRLRHMPTACEIKVVTFSLYTLGAVKFIYGKATTSLSGIRFSVARSLMILDRSAWKFPVVVASSTWHLRVMNCSTASLAFVCLHRWPAGCGLAGRLAGCGGQMAGCGLAGRLDACVWYIPVGNDRTKHLHHCIAACTH